MYSFLILAARWGFVVLALLPLVAYGQALWLLSPVGFGPRQHALSGAALLSSKGAAALSSNPAEVASLRGFELLASGAFSLSMAKLHPENTQRRFLAKPQVSAAWRLPEGFAVGLAWGRGEVAAQASSLAGGLSYVPLHRLLANAAWELMPGFRLGAELQLATTESAAWPVGEEGSWRGGRLAKATRAGVSIELIPKQCSLAFIWEEGLSLASRRSAGPKLKTPHSLALALGVASADKGFGAWEFEANFVYGWQRSWAEASGEREAHEQSLGGRIGMGFGLTPVIQLRAGLAVFIRPSPRQASWLQPMDAWSSSLSVGALWRYGPMRVEIAWQTLAGFESPQNPSPQLKQHSSNLLSLGLGWNFD